MEGFTIHKAAATTHSLSHRHLFPLHVQRLIDRTRPFGCLLCNACPVLSLPELSATNLWRQS